MIIACGLEIQMSDLVAREEEAAEMQMLSFYKAVQRVYEDLVCRCLFC